MIDKYIQVPVIINGEKIWIEVSIEAYIHYSGYEVDDIECVVKDAYEIENYPVEGE